MTHDPNTPHDHPHPHPHSAQDGINFLDTTPILNVACVPASLDYYTRVLGFTVGFAWANETGFERGSAPPTFAGVARGNWSVQLGQQVQGGPGMWVYVDVGSAAELDALHHEYQHSGARIAVPPEDKPWGMREMLVTDLDGHTFRLGAPLPRPA